MDPRSATSGRPTKVERSAGARQGVLPLIGAEVKPVQTTFLETALGICWERVQSGHINKDLKKRDRKVGGGGLNTTSLETALAPHH